MMTPMLRVNIVSEMTTVCYQMMGVTNPQVDVANLNVVVGEHHIEPVTGHPVFAWVARLLIRQNQFKVAIEQLAGGLEIRMRYRSFIILIQPV